MLETEALGDFSEESEIEALLNSSLYSVQMYAGETVLASMDNSNALWDLRYGWEPGESTVTTLLTISPSEITLRFYTPNESTQAQLLLMRSWDVDDPFTLQYAQFNNVYDYNFAHLDYNAIHQAAAFDIGYGTTFRFPAIDPPTQVPEPGALSLFGIALMGMLTTRRRWDEVTADRISSHEHSN